MEASTAILVIDTAILAIDIDKNNRWGDEIDSLVPERREVATRIRALLDAARAEGQPIIFIAYPESGFSGQEMQLRRGVIPDGARKVFTPEAIQLVSSEKCIGCDSGRGIPEFLAHRHGEGGFEPVFIKASFNAFTNQALAGYLHGAGITDLILIGCITNVCVFETGVGGVENGFNVTMRRDCVYPSCSEEEGRKWIGSVKSGGPCCARVNVE